MSHQTADGLIMLPRQIIKEDVYPESMGPDSVCDERGWQDAQNSSSYIDFKNKAAISIADSYNLPKNTTLFFKIK